MALGLGLLFYLLTTPVNTEIILQDPLTAALHDLVKKIVSTGGEASGGGTAATEVAMLRLWYLWEYFQELGFVRVIGLVLLGILFWFYGPRFRSSVYCVDFVTAGPEIEGWQLSRAELMGIIRAMGEKKDQNSTTEEGVKGGGAEEKKKLGWNTVSTAAKKDEIERSNNLSSFPKNGRRRGGCPPEEQEEDDNNTLLTASTRDTSTTTSNDDRQPALNGQVTDDDSTVATSSSTSSKSSSPPTSPPVKEDPRRYSAESINFMERILSNSGIGDKTHWPPGVLQVQEGKEYDASMTSAQREYESVVFPIVEKLFAQTNTRPEEIDFLVVNCSLFCSTPSLCAALVNKFRMRHDIRSYNLGGMGCSAGVISIDLAKQLLENSAQHGGLALVVSTEIITEALYRGNDRSMMMQNTLFRCGGAAILLSSSSRNRRLPSHPYAKYKLLHSGRTFMTDDESYRCVFQQCDADGNKGVRLDRNIVNVAGRALTKQFTYLGPHILPMVEQLKCVRSYFCSWLYKNYLSVYLSSYYRKEDCPKIYTPDFRKAIDFFCIHAGGRAVIEGVQKNLNLSDRDVEPSFETLKQFGNTSSSSIWYELEYIEKNAKRMGLRQGHRVLQIAFGSGFKCNSAVWLKL